MSEILGRWRVLLNTLKVLDSLEGLFSLFIDNSCELGILVLYFLDNFFLNTLLFLYSILHGGALLKGSLCLTKQLLKHANLILTSLFECHTATTPTMVVEVAIVAKGFITDATVGRQDGFVITITHSDFSLWDLKSFLNRLRRLLCAGLCSCFDHSFSC